MTDNDPNRGPGSPGDPAYHGAKPASFSPDDRFGFFANVGDPHASAAMSALLAQNWWAIAVRGACSILFGIVALLLPGVTVAALVLLFAAYMLVDGVFAIVAGVRAARAHERWGLLALEGIADIVAGAIAFIWPLITVLAFIYIMAAWAIVTGILLLGATFRLQPTHGKWLMGLGGAVSVVWGILLILQPIVGALVLTWWIGAYAIVFGAVLLTLALRLRRRQHDHPHGQFHTA